MNTEVRPILDYIAVCLCGFAQTSCAHYFSNAKVHLEVCMISKTLNCLTDPLYVFPGLYNIIQDI
jgi:hypothetical protein